MIDKTNAVTHTPLPWATRDLGLWSVDHECGNHASWAIGSDDTVVAIAVTRGWHDEPEFLANAALIVRAVNSHADLIALAHQYASDLRHPPSADSRERRLERIAAVLAKVGS
jgi:hypothetical protein